MIGGDDLRHKPMTYECDCGWTSGPDTDGQSMPDYMFANGMQYAHCPDCAAILSEIENTTRPL